MRTQRITGSVAHTDIVPGFCVGPQLGDEHIVDTVNGLNVVMLDGSHSTLSKVAKACRKAGCGNRPIYENGDRFLQLDEQGHLLTTLDVVYATNDTIMLKDTRRPHPHPMFMGEFLRKAREGIYTLTGEVTFQTNNWLATIVGGTHSTNRTEETDRRG